MADNYLEKKMEEYKARPWSTSGGKNHKTATTLNRLLVKNRKYDNFDNTVIVRKEHLKSIAEVINKIEFVDNISVEDFRVELFIFEKPEQIKQLNAKAFIVVKYNTNQDKFLESHDNATLYFNLGIIAQSMLLRATEMGLNGNCIYHKELHCNNEQFCARVAEEKSSELQNEEIILEKEKTSDGTTLLIIAIGKGTV